MPENPVTKPGVYLNHLQLPNGAIACGAKYPELWATSDWLNVTCLACLASLTIQVPLTVEV